MQTILLPIVSFPLIIRFGTDNPLQPSTWRHFCRYFRSLIFLHVGFGLLGRWAFSVSTVWHWQTVSSKDLSLTVFGLYLPNCCCCCCWTWLCISAQLSFIDLREIPHTRFVLPFLRLVVQSEILLALLSQVISLVVNVLVCGRAELKGFAQHLRTHCPRWWRNLCVPCLSS